MSHFFTVVLLPMTTPDVEAAVEKAMAPFHEFECTGTDNEYVKDIDKTAEVIEEFNKQTERRVRTPGGELVCAYDDRFYRDPTQEEAEKIGPIAGAGSGHGMSWTSKDWGDGQGYCTKVRCVPDGHEEVEVATKDTESFAEWLNGWYGWETVPHGEQPDLSEKHKYGYILLDENGNVAKCVDRTNPNDKWDWYSIGGRYTGRLGQYFPDRDPANYETCWICGGTGTRADTTYPADVTTVRAGQPIYPCIGQGCNACYGAGKTLKFPSNFRDVGNMAPVATLDADFKCFAFVTPEGEWIERGSMGWFGCVSGEKDETVWDEQRRAVLEKYRDCFAVGVDCHI